MWPFKSKDRVLANERESIRKKQEVVDQKYMEVWNDRVDKQVEQLVAFRKVGEGFVYLNKRYVVIRVIQNRINSLDKVGELRRCYGLTGSETSAELQCQYRLSNGKLSTTSVYVRDLAYLIPQCGVDQGLNFVEPITCCDLSKEEK